MSAWKAGSIPLKLKLGDTSYDLRLLSDTVIVLMCPQCGQKLRLNRGQFTGAEQITCTRDSCGYVEKRDFLTAIQNLQAACRYN